MEPSTEHAAEIERLVAERVARIRRQDRIQIVVWIAGVALIVFAALAAGLVMASREIRSLQQRLEQQSQALEAARAEYMRQLEHDRTMQAEREAAAKAVGYRPGQSQAAHNASMLREFVSFMGQSNELRERIKKVDGSDPKDLERLAGDLEQVLGKGLGTLGQIVLRNTEPEKLQAGPSATAPPAR